MAVLNNPAGYLLSGSVASGLGAEVMDARHCANYGYAAYQVTVASAILTLEASHDSTAWVAHAVVTATTTLTTAQVAAYAPYWRAGMRTRYGAATAQLFYAPGLT